MGTEFELTGHRDNAIAKLIRPLRRFTRKTWSENVFIQLDLELATLLQPNSPLCLFYFDPF